MILINLNSTLDPSFRYEYKKFSSNISSLKFKFETTPETPRNSVNVLSS